MNNKVKIIDTPKMPKANGHYSQCIEHNGILYLSGQLPIDQKSKTIPLPIEEQTDLVLKNINNILTEAGSTKNHILQVRIYISDIGLWDKVDRRYSVFFQEHRPTRCIVPTRELHFNCLIEIEITAIVDRKE